MINLPEEYEKEMRSLLGAEFEEYKKIYEQPADRDCVLIPTS